jgi:hypothetical protein
MEDKHKLALKSKEAVEQQHRLSLAQEFHRGKTAGRQLIVCTAALPCAYHLLSKNGKPPVPCSSSLRCPLTSRSHVSQENKTSAPGTSSSRQDIFLALLALPYEQSCMREFLRLRCILSPPAETVWRAAERVLVAPAQRASRRSTGCVLVRPFCLVMNVESSVPFVL